MIPPTPEVWTVTYVDRSIPIPSVKVFVHEMDARLFFSKITQKEVQEATEYNHETGTMICFHSRGPVTIMERHSPLPQGICKEA